MKKSNFFLLGALSILCSCVNDKYDLNMDISKDVKIEGNKITLPFGSLKAITLDSLIDVKDIDVLEKDADGGYSITKGDTIETITKTVDPIELAIDEQNEQVEIEFTDAEIDEVEIKAADVNPATFEMPEISFDELNNSLPKLSADASQSVANNALKEKLQIMKNQGVSGAITFSLDELGLANTSQTIDSVVDYGFDNNTYDLPKEVKSVSKIELATKLQNNKLDTDGTLIKALIARPKAMTDIESTINFVVEFPENFVLTLTDKANECYSLVGNNVIKVKNLPITQEYTYVEFYIKDMIEVENLTIDNGRVISFDKLSDIEYTLDYNMKNGTVTVDPASISNVDEYLEENFTFKILFEETALAFCNVAGETNDIDVAFKSINMNFNGSFKGLENIERINYIDFNSDSSRIKFRTEMKKEDAELLKDISIKNGYALKVEFAKELVFNIEQSEYPQGVVYDSQRHSFYIKSFKALDGGVWNLALDSLNLNLAVENEACVIDMNANIFVVDPADDAVDSLVIASFKLESLSTMLDKFKGKKSAEFNMEDTQLIVDEASVKINRISSDLTKEVELSFDEEVPSEIESIKSIDFTDNASVRFEMAINGLNDLNADINLDMKVKLPSFLKLTKSEKCTGVDNVVLENDTLRINTTYNPSKSKENINIELLCTSLDFANGEFSSNGLVPVDSIDLKFIKYKGKISVTGEACIEGTDFSSKLLDEIGEVINLDINFAVDTINVESFHGIYDGEIDESTQLIKLDLGDELDFLKDEGNSIVLAEPQIEISLSNSVSVPVDVDLTITGLDDNDAKTSEIYTTLKIHPADYDEQTGVITAKDTKLFLTSDIKRVSKAGCDNIEVKDLATILDNKVPTNINLTIKPRINKESTHHIDITKAIKFSGEYSVHIPLKFDNLEICYTDTLEDLNEDMGETLEKLRNVSLNLNLDVVNSMPLNLELTVEPYDVAGNFIEDITIEPVTLQAGAGGNINDPNLEETVQKVVLVVKSKGSSLSMLDKIVIKAIAMDRTVGGEGLRHDQGLKIKNIIVEAKGDIETELE